MNSYAYTQFQPAHTVFFWDSSNHRAWSQHFLIESLAIVIDLLVLSQMCSTIMNRFCTGTTKSMLKKNVYMLSSEWPVRTHGHNLPTRKHLKHLAGAACSRAEGAFEVSRNIKGKVSIAQGKEWEHGPMQLCSYWQRMSVEASVSATYSRTFSSEFPWKCGSKRRASFAQWKAPLHSLK